MNKVMLTVRRNEMKMDYIDAGLKLIQLKTLIKEATPDSSTTYMEELVTELEKLIYKTDVMIEATELLIKAL